MQSPAWYTYLVQHARWLQVCFDCMCTCTPHSAWPERTLQLTTESEPTIEQIATYMNILVVARSDGTTQMRASVAPRATTTYSKKAARWDETGEWSSEVMRLLHAKLLHYILSVRDMTRSCMSTATTNMNF